MGPSAHSPHVWESGGVTTVGQLLTELSVAFRNAGIQNAAVDAELLTAHVLQETRGRVQTLAVLDSQLAEQALTRIRELAAERVRRVPLQHLTGKAPFRQLELAVGPGVFVPRPETETVAELAISAARSALPDPLIAVDLCTGSGTLALALVNEVPNVRVLAVEKSPEAHAWASRNVAQYGEGRVTLLLGDIAELDAQEESERTPLAEQFAPLEGRVSLVVSNPPYVPESMVPRDPEVRDHDPALALYSGADGLDLIRVISRVAQRLLAVGGVLVIEHAETQGEAIRALLTRDGWLRAETHQDLTLRDRATTAIR